MDISIITPVSGRDNRNDYLIEAGNSIRDASDGLDVEWVIVRDGHNNPIPHQVMSMSNVVVIDLSQRFGAAVARNVGLYNASGQWITSLDDDDMIPIDSLKHRFDVAKNQQVKWVGALLSDLHPDGSQTLWDAKTPRGYVPAGKLKEVWGTPSKEFPIAPTSLLVDREYLISVGGWQALPQGEDFGMVMAVTNYANGYVLDESVYFYRKHEGQMMRQSGFNEMETLARNMAFHRK